MITTIDIPGLELLHRGKVRDSFRIDATRRLIVVTDRISAFDLKIKTPIPRKGEVLNRLAAFWFDETKAIVENHLHAVVDPQAMVVTEATPIRVEMVVRGAISGSMWRGYQKGVRTFSGVTVGEGLTENALLPEPIVTPTTKEESDREITPKEIVDTGLVSRATYVQMEQTALALFQKGRDVAARRGLILADTKYEFGLVGDALILIDEIHTPDSSRFWDREAYDADPANVPSFDKEFVRKWMRANQVSGELPTVLPDDVVAETARRYATLFERVTGQSLGPVEGDAEARLLRNLVTARILRDSKAPVSSRRGAS
jgi:phosphoribosylaminoimidazole-succinocarboxamide synthase